jgi:3-oxoacyl-(acyl-carrier-protein) synthase
VGDGDGEGVPHRLLQRLHRGSGPSAAVSCACASGLSALALAGRWIRSGHADEVVVVGVDVLNEFILDGFRGLLALDEHPCRPYDATREGLNLGDGAAAIRLGTRPTEFELLSWGESNDATHVTAPARDGAGLARAAQFALDRAGLAPQDIDLVHGHGTGTPFNDAMEGQAILRVFGTTPPPLCASKGQIGHTLGAAALLESIIAMEALRRGIAPANTRLETTDLDSDILLPRQALALPGAPGSSGRTALKWAAGFGGINAAVIFQAA